MSALNADAVLKVATSRRKLRDASSTLGTLVKKATAASADALSAREASAALRYALRAAAAAKAAALSPNAMKSLSLTLSSRDGQDFATLLAEKEREREERRATEGVEADLATHAELLDVLSVELKARQAAAERCAMLRKQIATEQAALASAEAAGRSLATQLAAVHRAAGGLRAAARAAGASFAEDANVLRQQQELPLPLYLVFARARAHARDNKEVTVTLDATDDAQAVVVAWPDLGGRVRFTVSDGQVYVAARPDVPLARLFSSLPGQSAAQDEQQPFGWAAVLGGDELALREVRASSVDAIFAAIASRFRVRASLAAQWSALEEAGVAKEHVVVSLTEHRLTLGGVPVLLTVPVDYPVCPPTVTLMGETEVGRAARQYMLAAMPVADVAADSTTLLRAMAEAFATAATSS
jgi:hypothetical protein